MKERGRSCCFHTGLSEREWFQTAAVTNLEWTDRMILTFEISFECEHMQFPLSMTGYVLKSTLGLSCDTFLFLCHIYYSSGLGFVLITRCLVTFCPDLILGCWGQKLFFKFPAHTGPCFEHLKCIKSKVNVDFMLSFGAGKYKTWAPGMAYFLCFWS